MLSWEHAHVMSICKHLISNKSHKTTASHLQSRPVLAELHGLIIASPVHHQVGLVAEGGHECRAGSQHDGHADQLRPHSCVYDVDLRWISFRSTESNVPCSAAYLFPLFRAYKNGASSISITDTRHTLAAPTQLVTSSRCNGIHECSSRIVRQNL